MSLKTKLTVGVSALLTGALDLNIPYSPLDYTQRVDLATGTGAGQADRIWHDQRTLAASATENLDLAGALLDALSGPFVLARVKALVVRAAAGNTNDVVVGAAAGAPWTALLGATGTLVVRPGTTVAVFAGEADAVGYAVTATTADLLKVANSAGGTSVTYDIAIVGASA